MNTNIRKAAVSERMKNTPPTAFFCCPNLWHVSNPVRPFGRLCLDSLYPQSLLSLSEFLS